MKLFSIVHVSGKKRPEWHGDTKIMATSFDELWEDQDGHRRDPSPGKKSRTQNDLRSSWAAVGLVGYLCVFEEIISFVFAFLFLFHALSQIYTC